MTAALIGYHRDRESQRIPDAAYEAGLRAGVRTGGGRRAAIARRSSLPDRDPRRQAGARLCV